MACPIREFPWRLESSSLFFDSGLGNWNATTDHMGPDWTFCVGQVPSGERQGNTS